jgi:hypothetical protein
MKRERTIGSNPLDTVNTPGAAATPETSMTAGAAPEIEAARSGSRLAEASKSARAGITNVATGIKTQAQRLQTPEIVVLDGDQPPQDTRMSYDAEGRRGFRVGEDRFVAIGHDVASIAVRPAEGRTGVRNLLMWGAVGAFLAGPVGALAGGLLGGRKLHRVTADLHLNDGRTLTVVTGMSTLERMRKEIDVAHVA